MFRNHKMGLRAKRRERGVSMPEMALGGVLFFTTLFGIVEFGRALATYNALSEAVRRGARYAATQTQANVANVRNMVVYGTPTAGTSPVATSLIPADVTVTYTNFGMNSGQVKVVIPSYSFYFNVPMFGANYHMNPFSATANAESAGIVPSNI